MICNYLSLLAYRLPTLDNTLKLLSFQVNFLLTKVMWFIVLR